MADEFRAQRAAAEAKRQEEQAREALKPDILTSLPQLLESQFGLSHEEVALALRNGIFTLYPEDAPPEHRQQMWEAAQSRKERQAQQDRQDQEIQRYRYQCEYAARAAKEDEFPDSTAFYDGDVARYAKAIEKKALAMATEAQQKGLYIDVTIPAVQRALEQDLAAKLSKAEQKRASRNKPATPATQATSQSVASNVRTAATAMAAPARAKKTLAEANAEIMALLQGSFNR